MNRKTPKQTTAERKREKGFKNPEYLIFLGQFPSRFSLSWGNPVGNPIELHHEACSTGFLADKKSWNDYQAIPLTREEHALRHTQTPESFWGEKNPHRIVSALIKNFAKKNSIPIPKELQFFPKESTPEEEKEYIKSLTVWIHGDEGSKKL